MSMSDPLGDMLTRIRNAQSAKKKEVISPASRLREGASVINEIYRVSTPGRRVYSSVKDLPRVYNGLGISIISTPQGVMSDNEARKANVGGEILCQVF